jgi:hypothetical protein
MVTDFFTDFPKILYSQDDFESEQVVTDILRRVVLTKEFKENTAFLEEHEIIHGETPEQVSHRFYGTTNLHWLVLLVNDIIDPRFEWPTSEENLTNITREKYGGDASIFTRQNAFNKNGKRVETFFLLAENSTYKNPVRLMFETNDENFTKQPIVWRESDAITTYETNFDIEAKRNETNRSIKILKPDIVVEVINQYKELINK